MFNPFDLQVAQGRNYLHSLELNETFHSANPEWNLPRSMTAPKFTEMMLQRSRLVPFQVTSPNYPTLQCRTSSFLPYQRHSELPTAGNYDFRPTISRTPPGYSAFTRERGQNSTAAPRASPTAIPTSTPAALSSDTW